MSPDPITGLEEKCAFCRMAPVVKFYVAAPILTVLAGELVFFERTKWLACAACAALIDRDQWPELEDHLVREAIRQLPEESVLTGNQQLQFFRYRAKHLLECVRKAMRATA